MKQLEFNQMEKIEGGSCRVAAGAYSATITAGPLGASMTVAVIGLVEGCFVE